MQTGHESFAHALGTGRADVIVHFTSGCVPPKPIDLDIRHRIATSDRAVLFGRREGAQPIGASAGGWANLGKPVRHLARRVALSELGAAW